MLAHTIIYNAKYINEKNLCHQANFINPPIRAVANVRIDLVPVIFLQKLPKKMKNGKQTFIYKPLNYFDKFK